MTDRCVLAYSGGLDTSVAARTLREERGLEVVAAFVDLGQPFDRAEVEERAAAAEVELHIVDARDAFASQFCLPALHANALYEGKYPLVSALARPLIAAEVVRLARETGGTYVAHGCTGKGNDQVRFETSFAALAPDLGVIAPVREEALSREESLVRAKKWGIPIQAVAKTYSVDENLWGRTIECGELEDPWAEPPADAFELTIDPRHAPNEPVEVVIGFRNGTPMSLDGGELPIVELVARLTEIAGAHGFGRVDMIENRLVGIKSRELYEVPGALALIAAHRELEDLTLERDLAHEKAGLERRWAELCYYGQWYGPLHAGLRAFMAETQADVTGEVRVRFHKGNATVMGRRSPRSLYDLSLATYDQKGDSFDHRQAAGFVSLWSLPIKVWAARDSEVQSSPSQQPPSREPTTARGAGAEGVPAPPVRPEPLQAEGVSPTWAARFESAPADSAMSFTRSVGFDRRLITQDLLATRLHVVALARAGLITDDERNKLDGDLQYLGTLARDGTFPFDEADEDVHSAVERVLTERLGDIGAKIHAGRSRNDLVVMDLRLWITEAAGELATATEGLAEALAARAEEHAETVMPGYTHLQRAQPITLGHHLLAHAFPLTRDADRFRLASATAGVSGLGAGALGTSTLGISGAEPASILGFAVFDNSIDAVSDRDFALDFLSACVSTAVHLSRLGEDLVLWSSQEFGFARASDGFATGSSMMPQKRNPDVAELARGKTGRVLGDYVRLATVLKGLPLAYARDLQEDKEAVFDAHDALLPALEALAGMIDTLAFDTERMRIAAADPSLLATDLAEHLVKQGVPFREAHAAIGSIVAKLESEGRTIGDVKADEWPELDPRLDGETIELLDAEISISHRAGPGGPSPSSVRAQAQKLRDKLIH
ncbi:MAG: argininosuccinate synthase [Actinomycetota bacterium]